MQLFVVLALNQLDPLIEIQRGELPIVISAPHGGRLPIPNCPLRVNYKVPQFVTVLDTNSDKLAHETAAELEKALGKKPWVVIAKFSRKYVDANRPVEHGAESDEGKKVYERYHSALNDAVALSRTQPGALLIDFHAQGKSKITVYRGSNNLRSIRASDRTRFLSEGGFLWQLEQSGINLSPACKESEAKEDASFNGGYITQHYGATQPNGMNAIQLEVGADYRTKTSLVETARKIAQAIESHLKSAKTE